MLRETGKKTSFGGGGKTQTPIAMSLKLLMIAMWELGEVRGQTVNLACLVKTANLVHLVLLVNPVYLETMVKTEKPEVHQGRLVRRAMPVSGVKLDRMVSKAHRASLVPMEKQALLENKVSKDHPVSLVFLANLEDQVKPVNQGHKVLEVKLGHKVFLAMLANLAKQDYQDQRDLRVRKDFKETPVLLVQWVLLAKTAVMEFLEKLVVLEKMEKTVKTVTMVNRDHLVKLAQKVTKVNRDQLAKPVKMAKMVRPDNLVKLARKDHAAKQEQSVNAV